MGRSSSVLRALAVALVILALGAPGARARIVQGGPNSLAGMRTLSDVMREAGDGTVQLVFVHGMRATGAGTSDRLRGNLARRLGLSCAKEPPRALNIGKRPGVPRINDVEIWPTEEDWRASTPFVARHVCAASGGAGATLVVDEVNWWPLLFPVKCRFLVGPDSQLSGGRGKLSLCGRWIDSAALKAAKPASGGGAKLNALAKQELLDWGFADAVMALGPMRELFRLTMERAFEAADDSTFSETVIVSESLGSFVVLEALAEKEPSVLKTFDRTANVYFFANQFALLSLARVQDLVVADPAGEVGRRPAPEPSPFGALEDWSRRAADLATRRLSPPHPRQIVAFSDPSDLLTFCVPRVGGVRVANVFVRNQRSFLGLFADPASAHTGHSGNPDVLRVLLDGETGAGSGRDPRCYAVE